VSKQSASVIPGDPALLYEILTDYEHLGEWMPRIAGGKLLAREGDLVLAELELKGRESSRFSMECIHSKDKMVVWRPIENKISAAEVRWEIVSTPEGRCRVSLAVDRRFSLARLASFRSGLMNPGECLRALARQVSMFLPDAAPDTEGERILEITETQQGLACWIRGKKYKLVPAGEDQGG